MIHAKDPEAVVRSVYEAFGRHDVEAVLAAFDDEIEIRQSDALPWGGVYRGKEEALSFFAALTSHIRTQVDIDRLIVAGDGVVESGRACGTAVATGREFEIDEVHIWRVRDGKIAGMHAFVDEAAMLAAISQG
jgi:ketosteroid isomerase-like protein